MKKIIGLIPLYDDEKESYWMLPGYMKALEACGALPIMLPLTISPAMCSTRPDIMRTSPIGQRWMPAFLSVMAS